MWCQLLIFGLLGVAYSAKGGFKVVIDGQDIEDEAEGLKAMGVWGVDLVEDTELAVSSKQPNSMKIKAKDIKNTRQLSRGALGYMMSYGYLEAATEKSEEELLESDNLLSDADLRKAVRKFQKFNGLRQTGRPDPETLRLMSKPRCGTKDLEYVKPNRAKRYATSRNRWEKHDLTYWFNPEAWSEDMTRELFRSEFEAALKLWADAGHVNFIEVDKEELADIKIGFYYGDHGDRYPFSGPGWELAHAFYPLKGLLHFDDAEPFTANTVNGINFKFVALHEMGHILGIKHTDADNRDAIMYALYTGYSDDLQLSQDDKDAVVDRMGVGSGTVTPLGGGGDNIITVPPTSIPDTPPECISDIDAAFHFDSNPGYAYVFSGAWYYRLKPKNPDRMYNLPVYDTSSPPKRIGIDGFLNLPRNMDAAVALLQDANRYYVFKGENYIVYDIMTDSVKQSGPLSELWPTDTPTKIETAIRIDYETLGFLSGDRMYKYQSGEWITGAPGSNYFKDNYPHMTAATRAFYKDWVWVFQGSWYSIVRPTTGVASTNYQMRPIENDIKLPMCQEVAGALSTKQRNKCVRQLRFMRNRKGYKPDVMCLDFIAERYKGEADFNDSDFE